MDSGIENDVLKYPWASMTLGILSDIYNKTGINQESAGGIISVFVQFISKIRLLNSGQIRSELSKLFYEVGQIEGISNWDERFIMGRILRAIDSYSSDMLKGSHDCNTEELRKLLLEEYEVLLKLNFASLIRDSKEAFLETYDQVCERRMSFHSSTFDYSSVFENIKHNEYEKAADNLYYIVSNLHYEDDQQNLHLQGYAVELKKLADCYNIILKKLRINDRLKLEQLEKENAKLKEGKIKVQEENKQLKQTIEELRAESKFEVKRVISDAEGYEFLKTMIDLGQITEELPLEIPIEQKWDARDFPKEMKPEEKAKQYLERQWKHFPVTRGFFNNTKGGKAFIRYLERNHISELLPTSAQIKQKLFKEHEDILSEINPAVWRILSSNVLKK